MNILKQLVSEEIKKRQIKRLKESIKGIILEELNTLRTARRYVTSIDSKVKSVVGKWAGAFESKNGSMIYVDDGEGGYNFDVKIEIVGRNKFNVKYRIDDVKDRSELFDLTLDDILKWIDDNLKGRKKLEKINSVGKLPNAETDKKSTESAKSLTKAKAPSVEDKKIETVNHDMEDASKFKKQSDMKGGAEIAKGGKVSRAKEMATDKEKEIKTPKKTHRVELK